MACLPEYIFDTTRLLLCIKTNKRLLCTLFPGQNHLYRWFNIFFHFKTKKEKAQENYEKYMKQRVYQHLGATPKHWQAPGPGQVIKLSTSGRLAALLI